MKEDLHRYLDGELEPEALAPELRREAEAWDRLLADVRETGPASAPAGFETRVLHALDRGAGESAWTRTFRWWMRPRQLRVSPLAGLMAAAAIAALILVPGRGSSPIDDTPIVTGPLPERVVYVQFLLRAPDASQVAVAGDFTDWLPEIALTDSDGDGIWSVQFPVEPGVHEYMFVVDGERWVEDPLATRYEEDGYGHRNAVLAIAPPASGL